MAGSGFSRVICTRPTPSRSRSRACAAIMQARGMHAALNLERGPLCMTFTQFWVLFYPIAPTVHKSTQFVTRFASFLDCPLFLLCMRYIWRPQNETVDRASERKMMTPPIPSYSSSRSSRWGIGCGPPMLSILISLQSQCCRKCQRSIHDARQGGAMHVTGGGREQERGSR